ncbi:MAG: GGDEF-domain containing protein [Rhodospirillaceae bacterium]|nr:GGDEF-domain containing protein [Rhodospirillaceae bacterium]
MTECDHVTGLANYARLQDRLEQAIAGQDPAGPPLWVLLVDLDCYTDVTLDFGPDAADYILSIAAQRLQSCLPRSAMLARLYTDHFAAAIPDSEPPQIERYARKCRKALTQSISVEGIEVVLEPGMGASQYSDGDMLARSLVRQAGIAKAVAKNAGRDFAVYVADHDRRVRQNLVLMHELRRAVQERQLLLHYQPKVDLRTGRVNGVEALVRWQHPLRGMVMPDEFIPIAERTAAIRPLTAWVLDTSMEQLARWRAKGLDFILSANLSVKNLEDPDLPDAVQRLLAKHGLPNEALQLEITETAVMQDPERSIPMLEGLADTGIELSIDDFGRGYGSLTYLQRFPASWLKIDKEFVIGMDADPRNATIVRAAIDMAHQLGMSVTAEGVETKRVLNLLRGLGCDRAQGYLFSKPVPADRIEELAVSICEE